MEYSRRMSHFWDFLVFWPQFGLKHLVWVSLFITCKVAMPKLTFRRKFHWKIPYFWALYLSKMRRKNIHFSSLSQQNIIDLERVQKSALKVILKDKYSDYESALLKLNIETLYKRRELLCYRFAKKGLKLSQFKKLFPVSKSLHVMQKRNQDRFIVNSAKTERYKRSSIPSMQRLLNKYDREFKMVLKSSVSNELYPRGSLVVKF